MSELNTKRAQQTQHNLDTNYMGQNVRMKVRKKRHKRLDCLWQSSCSAQLLSDIGLDGTAYHFVCPSKLSRLYVVWECSDLGQQPESGFRSNPAWCLDNKRDKLRSGVSLVLGALSPAGSFAVFTGGRSQSRGVTSSWVSHAHVDPATPIGVSELNVEHSMFHSVGQPASSVRSVPCGHALFVEWLLVPPPLDQAPNDPGKPVVPHHNASTALLSYGMKAIFVEQAVADVTCGSRTTTARGTDTR